MGPPQPTRKVRAREGGQQRPRPSVPALPVRRPKPSVAWAFTGTIPSAAHSLLRLGTGPSLSSLSLSLLRSKARGVPSVARPFTGQRVPRILCNAPVHPWLGRSPGPASTGRSPCSGSPTGLLSFSGAPIARLSLPHSPTRLSADSAAGWYTGYWSRPDSRPSLTPDTLGEAADQVATGTGPSRGRGCQG